MKGFVVLLLALALAACTSLKPLEIPPEQLQSMIAKGEVIAIGDNVKIITNDGKQHNFKVTEISETVVSGKNAKISIPDIVALETREFSGGKTALLTGSVYVVYVLLAAVASVATLTW
jgi:predicted small lipoprotein YifL